MFRWLRELSIAWSVGQKGSTGEMLSIASPAVAPFTKLKSPGPFQPPPLQVDDIVYETQMDKANALRRATLERRTSDDDIMNPWTSVYPPRSIPFSPEISLDEVQYATLNTGNISPGSDNITVDLLKAVWHIIRTHIRRLFEGCLYIGHDPKPFKEAEVVMIAKPGRRDLTSPRA
ncbi:hypothetical protein ACKAV7_011935 [Fusarium commune]